MDYKRAKQLIIRMSCWEGQQDSQKKQQRDNEEGQEFSKASQSYLHLIEEENNNSNNDDDDDDNDHDNGRENKWFHSALLHWPSLRPDCPSEMNVWPEAEAGVYTRKNQRRELEERGGVGGGRGWKAVKSALAKERRESIKRKKKKKKRKFSLLTSVILLIIGYELLSELCQHLVGDKESGIRGTNRSFQLPNRLCHKCLPNIVFRSCSAFEVEVAEGREKPSSLISTLPSSPLVEDVRQLVAQTNTMEQTITGNNSEAKMIKNDTLITTTMATSHNNANETSFTTSQKQFQLHPAANNNNSAHNHNVLCNSRCLCVLLEALDGSGSGLNQQFLKGNSREKEQIDFDEDYSVDYEDEQTKNETTTKVVEQNSSFKTNSSGKESLVNEKKLALSEQATGNVGRQLQEEQFRERENINQRNNQNSSKNNLLQPLASGGRGELSPAQLYAQSVFTSQAPKLSLHAHTLTPSLAGKLEELPLQAPPLAKSQNYSPFPHSLRSNYLSHHLRTQQNINNNNNNNNNNGKNNLTLQPSNASGQLPSRLLPKPENFATTLPQQQRLIPLKTLNYNTKLLNHTATLYGTNNNFNNSNYSNNNPSNILQQANNIKPALDNDLPSAQAPFSWSTNNNNNNNEQMIQNLNWTNAPKLIDEIERMLMELEKGSIQSLTLAYNDLQFELWSELYALLASPLRQHLYHLDLSHNSLVKLGVTFTGYLEHHLALHNNTWPFSSSPSSSSSSISSQGSTLNQHPRPNNSATSFQQDSYNFGSESKLSASNINIPKAQIANSRLRHTLVSGGKLYNIIQQRIQSNLRSANQAESKMNTFNSTTTTTTTKHGTHLLQQPMLIRALDLSHNKIKWLINDQFRTLKHLQTMRLDNNKIRYIHQHAFSGLESLRFLNLNFNRIQVIYIEQFQTNYNLLALMLRANSLAYLRGGSFSSLSNLKRLDLSKNKLTIMSSNALVGLESLEILNCSSNQLAHAPSASLHPLSSLRHLDLSDNLISQLAPGTFFHMPIEELWLNSNEQLVAIERGAFWDLPYLKKLHLNFNPMLMSVNSQAFVGTQSLQTIEVEGCQLLELSTRQMLENVTMAVTSRLLRHEQQQQQQQTGLSNNNGNNNNNNNNSTKNFQGFPNSNNSDSSTGSQLPSVTAKPQVPVVQPVAHINRFVPDEQLNNLATLGAKLNYASYLGTMALLVLVLKLTFKYTSSNRYIERRRRRRRVYEASSNESVSRSGASDKELPDSEESVSRELCDLQPQVILTPPPLTGGSQQPTEQQYNYVDCLASGQNGVKNDNADRISIDESSRSYNLNGEEEDNKGNGSCSVKSVILNAACPEEEKEKEEEQGQQAMNDCSAIECQQQACDCPSCPPVSIEVVSGVSMDSSMDLSLEQQIAEHQVLGDPLNSMHSNQQNMLSDQQQHQQQPEQQGQQQQQQQPQPSDSSAYQQLIQRQLLAAGLDYGHANCAHFYQSLQLADMTANFMDYYP